MQVAGRSLHRLVYLTSASILLIAVTVASAEDVPQMQHHQTSLASQERWCKAAIPGSAFLEGFESVQVETSDITRHEQFFEAVLHAPVVQSLDHPQVDSLRGYCYRGVLIVVRQDLRTVRPTGWVQINFTVSDVAALQSELGRVNTNGHFYAILRTWKSPTHSIAASRRGCRRNAAT